MNDSPRLRGLSAVFLAAMLLPAACHKSTDQNAHVAQNPSTDPATANLAPVSDTSAAPQPVQAGSEQIAQQTAVPPPQGENSYASGAEQDQYGDADYYGEEPAATAPAPPPPLPDYDQPPAPGDDYLWTPGYWSYAPTGYYWVPGVWVQAPYQGALWTPGFWTFRNNRYEFFHGYWGPHIGFYGGIDYGFGYGGTGYQGGYWNSGHFFVNRAINNVSTTSVHNVYDYRINNAAVNRVSFNGGSGGVQARPRPAELAARREPHAAPMASQLQIQHAAAGNRAQFATENHGRPANAAERQPVQADRNVRPVAPVQMHRGGPAPQVGQPGTRGQAAPAPGRSLEARPAQPQNPQQRPGPGHTAPSQPMAGQPAPREHRPEPQQRTAPQQQREAPRPEPHDQRQMQPQRQVQPQHQVQPQRQAQPQREAQPPRQAPQPHEAPAPRAAPPSRPESGRPAPSEPERPRR